MSGRVGSYIHSDNVSPDKGGCIVVVRTTTDFASRNADIKKFADMVAKFAYGASAGVNNVAWDYVKATFPDAELERARLASELKEQVEVAEIAVLKV